MEKLRESYVFDTQLYSRLTESQIQELHIQPQRLKESTSLNEVMSVANDLKAKLSEEDQKAFNKILNRLNEDGLSNSFKMWRLPIGKYGNMNGNKRVYPKQLWNNVKDKQASTWKGFCGLADHPVADNDPGEFKNQACIWHNMDVGDDNVVYGVCSFVGPYGHLAQEILEHGGRVGTSSSGFGDVDPITKTVDPNTYVIERLADLVLNPSQGTFGSGKPCTTSASEFLDDPTAGATIEFNKYKPVKENQQIQQKRSKIVADRTMKVDAVQQQQQNQTVTAPQGSTAAAGAGQAGAPTQITESNKEKNMGTLTKVEEKAFRKYVDGFINDANKIDNPIKRLNECVDILNCFEEGNCPDLKEAIEKQLIEEKGKLEKLVETVLATEQDYDMDITQFRESAERNTAQGLLLQEQVTDFKELCDGLSKRNQQLKEENETLKKKLNIHNKLSEKKIMLSNKEIVNKSSEVEHLEEQIMKLTDKNERLTERASKLAASNKEFEKENDILTSKLKEAGSIFKDVKAEKLTEGKKQDAAVNEIKKLREEVKQLTEINQQVEKNYDNVAERYEKLVEEFKAYKQEVNDTYNPVARLQPKFEERVGKYINFRENKGHLIESYWADQVKQYGDAILPFEDKIRGAKTLQEATNNFLKYKNQIDPNFAVAQPMEFAYRNRSERAVLYEHQGVVNPVEQYRESSLEQKNEDFLNQLKAAGLQ